MMTRVGWLLAAMLALAACQGTPSRQASPQPEPDAAAVAAAALERGDYARAAELYRSALLATPASVPLHYGLGVSASFLNNKAEAVRELVWVLEHGEPGSSEVRAARAWLKSVGALPRGESSATAPVEEEQAAAEPRKEAMATVHGRVVFGETPGEMAPKERQQLFLMEHPSKVNYFRIRTDERGNFRFENVPAGIYKLTDRAAGPPIWRLRVELKPGQDLSLDLSPANSTRVRDDFPEAALADGVRS